MIKMEIVIENIDFNSLIDLFLPALTEKLKQDGSPMAKLLSGGMPSSVVKTVFHSLPQEKKEQIAAELINSNAALIKERVEEFARQQNVGMTVASVTAEI